MIPASIEPQAETRVDRKTASLANLTSTVLDVSLQKQYDEEVITAVGVRAGSINIGDATEAVTGPLWAEVYRITTGGKAQLLDVGPVRSGGTNSLMIGAIGAIPYRDGDNIKARVVNRSGATVTAILEVQTGVEHGAAGFTRLSSYVPSSWQALDSGNVAGNFAGVLGTILPGVTGEIWELGAVIASYLCDATVASRLIKIRTMRSAARDGRGGASIPPTAARADDETVTLTLTASQQGSLTSKPAPGGGNEETNTFGTYAYTADRPFPQFIEGDGTISLIVTAGVVGDVARLVVYARRVA